jgi:hypothetical protein
MINNENSELNTDFLSERQQFAFKGAVLLLCAAILALVFWSGAHETRTSAQCGKAGAHEGCLAESSTTTAYPPAKGALAPLGARSSERGAN